MIHQIAQDHAAEVIEREVMPDHVQLLIEVDPQYGIHKLVKQIKGRSSRLLRQEFPWLQSRLPSLWTNSYLVSTVGGAPLAVVGLNEGGPQPRRLSVKCPCTSQRRKNVNF